MRAAGKMLAAAQATRLPFTTRLVVTTLHDTGITDKTVGKERSRYSLSHVHLRLGRAHLRRNISEAPPDLSFTGRL